jgi:DNA-binding MarR family transcriptional regulator
MGKGLKKRIKQQKFRSTLQVSLLNLMVAADYVRTQMERFCSQYGITHAQFNLLRILRGVYPEGHPRCEIAERMIERAPDVTRLIDRLEKQGLVRRDRSSKDRRLSMTRITKKGLDLLDRAKADEQLYRYFSERLSTEDRKMLSRICETIYNNKEN